MSQGTKQFMSDGIPFLSHGLYWWPRSPWRWIAYTLLTAPGNFFTLPSCWCGVCQATWIHVSTLRIQSFSKGAVLALSQCAVTFLPNVQLLFLILQPPVLAVIPTKLLWLAPSHASHSQEWHCFLSSIISCSLSAFIYLMMQLLTKMTLKCISPLLFRTSEGQLVKSMTRTSYFWVPHSISKRWLSSSNQNKYVVKWKLWYICFLCNKSWYLHCKY